MGCALVAKRKLPEMMATPTWGYPQCLRLLTRITVASLGYTLPLGVESAVARRGSCGQHNDM